MTDIATIKARNAIQTKKAMASLKKFVKMVENQTGPRALEATLREVVNYAKAAAPYIDHTHNLRSSTSFKVMMPYAIGTATYPTKTEGLQSTGINNTSKYTTGCFFAGMEYAIHVERLDGYWVLTGAIETMKKNMTGTLKSELKINKLRMPEKE